MTLTHRILSVCHLCSRLLHFVVVIGVPWIVSKFSILFPLSCSKLMFLKASSASWEEIHRCIGSSGHNNKIRYCIFKNYFFSACSTNLQVPHCDSLTEGDLCTVLLPAQNPFRSYCFTGLDLLPLWVCQFQLCMCVLCVCVLILETPIMPVFFAGLLEDCMKGEKGQWWTTFADGGCLAWFQ